MLGDKFHYVQALFDFFDCAHIATCLTTTHFESVGKALCHPPGKLVSHTCNVVNHLPLHRLPDYRIFPGHFLRMLQEISIQATQRQTCTLYLQFSRARLIYILKKKVTQTTASLKHFWAHTKRWFLCSFQWQVTGHRPRVSYYIGDH